MNEGARQANEAIRHREIVHRLDRIIEVLVALSSPETTPAGVLDEKPDPRMGAVEAAFFALARDFTYTGPHDRETAHAIVAEHRPAIEVAILQAIRLADAALASTAPAGVLDEVALAKALCANREPRIEATDDMFVDDECRGLARAIAADFAAALGRSGSGGGRG